MLINGKNYTLAELRKLMPRYEMFFSEKVTPGSQEDKLDKNPIATTTPNLHMRYDSSKVVKREVPEITDRKYTFLGRIGTKIYSCKEKFIHDEADTTRSEVP